MATPAEPVILGFFSDTGTSGDNVTASRTLTFYGTGTPGASLEIMDSGPDGISGVGTLGYIGSIPANGEWSVTVGQGGDYPQGSDGVLVDGTYYVQAGSRDGPDASSRGPALVLTVDGPEMSAVDLAAGSDTGSSSTDNYTADSTPAVEFTAGLGDTVEIDWDDGRGFVAAGTGTGASQTVTIDQAYLVSSPKTEKTIQVRATKEGVSTTEQIEITLDRETSRPTWQLATDSDSGNSNNDGITRVAQPTIIGTAEAGATIEIRLTNGSGPALASTVVNGDGTYEVQLPGALDDGTYPLSIRAQDLAGNSFQSNSAGFTIDTTTATPSVSGFDNDTGAADQITTDATPRFFGTAEAGSTVEIFVDGVSAGTVSANNSGDWFFQSGTLAADDYVVTVQATDIAGNVSSLSSGYDISIIPSVTETPVVTGISNDSGTDGDGITNDPTLTVNGTAAANSSVQILLDGTVVQTVSANASGNWSAVLPSALADGNYEITAIAQSSGLNPSAESAVFDVEVDTVAPQIPTLDLRTTSDTGRNTADEITNGSLIQFDITGEPNSTMEFLKNGGDPFVLSPGPTGDSVLTAQYPEGTATYSVRSTDAAGNVTISEGLTVTIDRTAPNAPVIEGYTDNTIIGESGAVASRSVTLTGTSEPDALVSVVDGDNIVYAQAIADSEGNWSATGGDLADDTYLFSARAEDLAGNISELGDATSVTLRLDQTNSPIITGIAQDTNGADGVTSDNTLIVSGTATANATVEVFLGGVSLGTVVADETGAWSFDYTGTTLSDDDYVFTATARDADELVSEVSDPFDVTVDTTAPVPPTIDLVTASDSGDGTDNLTNDATPTLSGAGNAGDTIEIFDGTTSLGTSVVAPNGIWSFTPLDALSEGTKSFTAVATDTAGNVSAASAVLSVEIDVTPPANPVVTGISDDTGIDGDGVTSDGILVVFGTADPLTEIRVVMSTPSGSFWGVTTADASGDWSHDFASTMLEGEVLVIDEGLTQIDVTSIDLAGNSSISETFTVTRDATPPNAPTVALDSASNSGSSQDLITNNTTPLLQGEAEAGARIEIRQGEALLGSVEADENGAWAFRTPELASGTHSFDVVAVDLAGNTSTTAALEIEIDTTGTQVPLLDLDVNSDTGASTSDNVTNENQITLTATVEGAQNVRFLAGETELGFGVEGPAGVWTLTTDALADGVYSITAESSDVAANLVTSAPLEVTIDTLRPDMPTIALDAGSDTGEDDNITSDATPTFSGTAEAGSVVTLLARSGGEGEIQPRAPLPMLELGEVEANGSGEWSITSSDLPDGDYTIFAVSTDLAGNAISSEEVSVTIETVAPTAPTIDLNPIADTGAFSDDDITSETVLGLSGTSDPNTTVLIFDGDVQVGSVPVDVSGTWTFAYSEVEEGSRVLTARAVDVAGNSATSSELTVTVDLTPPTVPTLRLDAQSDSGADNSDNLTNDATPTFSGTAEAGTTVVVTVTNLMSKTAIELEPVVVGEDGTWSVTVDEELVSGPYDISVTSTDIAGNTVFGDSIAMEIDLTVPDAPSIMFLSEDTGLDGDGITSDDTPTLSGIALEGEVVTILRNGVVVGTVASIAGQWTFTSAALADGDYTFTATATDAAGNISTVSDEIAITVDTEAAAALTLDNSSVDENAEGGTLVGTVQTSEAVELTLTDDADGRFVLSGSDLLVVEGATLDYEEQVSRDVTVQATDQAGNVTATTLTVQLNDIEETFGGEAGPELIYGDAGDNTINAGDGDDTIFGGAGDDTIDGGTGNDSINGGEGNDALGDAFGNDTMDGGAGDDFLYMVSGDNELYGGEGDDLLIGGYDTDNMQGGAGNDVLRGDISTFLSGNDTLRGGEGDDLLEGGGGSDQFIFTTGDGNDTIGMLDIDTAARTAIVSGADFDSGVDQILLIGFGYADAAEAFSHVFDVDGVATFDDQGTTITFAGLTAADLSVDDFADDFFLT